MSAQAHATEPPTLLPALSRGKHRNPRKGACFMEFASFLAGERWSDHPACTHPLLAALARMVNDAISDERRPRLAPSVPAVIGLTSDDPRLDAHIVMHAAATVLPAVSGERQRVLAVAILSAERVLAELEDRPSGPVTGRAGAALAQAPHAARWASQFSDGEPTTLKGFRRYAAPTAVRCAVEGAAQACVSDPDQLLHDLLTSVIVECAAWLGRDAARPDPEQWSAACELTGAARR